MMKDLTRIESDTYFLDIRRLSSFGVSGIYLIIADGITLVETGTTLVAPQIFEAVKALGFQPEDIKHAIVTHIHLDHSGGTGWLVERLPNLKVYVHEKGLKHLRDPSVLIESAKSVYGSLESIIKMHGEILPVPDKNLNPVLNSTLDIGKNKSLQFFDAPGHASHHLCIFEPQSGCLFSGEALGHHHPETGDIQPAVAPPGFNFEASLETLEKIRDFFPSKICFSQYGVGKDASSIIDTSEQQLRSYYDLTFNLLKEGKSTAEVVEGILHQVYGDTESNISLFRGMLVSIVTGYEIYFRRKGLIKS